MISTGRDLTEPYLGFQTIALACGHGDVVPGLHERELPERSPEIYRRRGPDGALFVPDELLHHAEKLETYKTAIPEDLYPTTWVADRTIEYINRAEEPFFVWCGMNDPHHPFTPPGHYWDMFQPADMPAPVRRDGELEDKPPHFRGFYEGRYKDVDTDRWKLTWYANENYGELYDLEEDPDEFCNLWNRCDARVQSRLVSRLLDAVTANQDTLPPKLSHA